MFKIITFNANGIRAAARKGFFQWLNAQDADAVCIQETKAQLPQLEGDATYFPFAHNHYHDAEKKGYSGVALYLKHPPQAVQQNSRTRKWRSAASASAIRWRRSKRTTARAIISRTA